MTEPAIAAAKLYRPGDCVNVRFPTPTAPTKPGDLHTIVVLGLLNDQSGNPIGLMGAFTTSQPWRRSDREPYYIVPIAAENAARMNQRAHWIDCSTIGFIPISKEFIPEFGSGRQGIIGYAGAAFAASLLCDRVHRVAKSGELKQYGPLAPQPRQATIQHDRPTAVMKASAPSHRPYRAGTGLFQAPSLGDRPLRQSLHVRGARPQSAIER